MNMVTSKDGTRITCQRIGSGPPLILVDGAFCRRSFGPMPALAKQLAPHFTVTFYDRRGRGDSGDAPTYEVDREIEDIAALVDSIGGEAFVYGTSSGAVLAARAVAAGVKATKLAIYEPPLSLDGTHFPDPPDFVQQITAMLAADRRGEAVKLFMKVVGVPRFGILMMQLMPVFSGLKRTAHTLPYDFQILGDTQRGGPLPAELEHALKSITASTLVMAGGKSPPYLKHAARRVAETIPGGRSTIVPGQTHNASAKALAPGLIEFFTET
jgi:pimeloyl-ACP methyl ester carboxylesterase